MVRAYQINGKTIAIFCAVCIRYGRPVPFLLIAGLLEYCADVFKRMCEELGRRCDEIIVVQVGATFTCEDEPQESITRATFLSAVRPIKPTVQPFLSTEGTAIFENWTAFCL